MSSEFSKHTVIVNEFGIHARPAATIAQIAQDAISDVWIRNGNKKVDAKSIIDMLTLECTKGTQLKIIVTHRSDIDILNRIVELIENGFGE